MAIFAAGLTDALNSSTYRAYEQNQTKRMKRELQTQDFIQSQIEEQQRQQAQDQQKTQQAGGMYTQYEMGQQPQPPQVTARPGMQPPQPPPPGQPSQPMMRAFGPQGPQGPGGMQPPMPQPWQASPAAPKALGGQPPGAMGASGPPQIPPRPEQQLPPKQVYQTTESFISWLAKAHPEMKPEELRDIVQRTQPLRDRHNQEVMDQLDMQVKTSQAEEHAAKAVEAMRGKTDDKLTPFEKELKRLLDPETPAGEKPYLKAHLDRMDRIPGTGGGEGKPKFVEPVYPPGPDGRPDQTQQPKVVRKIFADGRIEYADAKTGQTIPPEMVPGGGGTAKEGAGSKLSVSSAQRQNLVKSGATNSLARLNEIEKRFPNATTSSFFGQHAENPLTRYAYGTGRSMQTKEQQEVDAKWSSFIDEAIPVFTGGLRGSDAFRRFLIEQAPAPGDKKDTVTEKMRLFRQNIQGTHKAFFNRFASDKDMWGPGVTQEDIDASQGQGVGKSGEGGGGEKPLTDKERQELEQLRKKYGR